MPTMTVPVGCILQVLIFSLKIMELHQIASWKAIVVNVSVHYCDHFVTKFYVFNGYLNLIESWKL